ncbi:MAG: SDR family NAD(P)-dependent oxidoreductase [Steroidobacteraceae bacterium]
MNNSFGATSTTDEVLQGIDLSAKRVLVTGVSAGLGVETARALAAHGAEVIGAARDLSKAQAATEQVRAQAASGGSLQLVQLDLASLDSVKKLPRRKSYVYIDIKRRKCKGRSSRRAHPAYPDGSDHRLRHRAVFTGLRHHRRVRALNSLDHRGG